MRKAGLGVEGNVVVAGGLSAHAKEECRLHHAKMSYRFVVKSTSEEGRR